MRVLSSLKRKNKSNTKLFSASTAILEPMEKRVLYTVGSFPVADWNFDTNVYAGTSYTSGTLITAPAPSFVDSSAVGTDTSQSLGMTLYNNSGSSPADDSAIASGIVGNGWKVVGNNGWSSHAALGTQGAQFNVDSTNYQALGLTFDWIPTSQGEAKLAVQYSTDGVTWSTAPASSLSYGTNAFISIGNNLNGTGGTIDSSVVPGGYFDSFNASGGGNYIGLSVDLSSISGITNDQTFAIRLVNAATGTTDNVSTKNTALNNTSGNWTFDDVDVVGTPINSVAPTFTSNPVSVYSNGGLTVSFKATASGVPAPSEQWQYSSNGGTSYTNVTNGSGGTTSTYNVSAGANLNGYMYRAIINNGTGGDAAHNVSSSAATLTVPTSPTITVQPVNEAVYVPSSVTFTATGFGPTVPTVQWQSSTGSGYTNVTGGTQTYNSTTGVATYTYTPVEGDTGKTFEAVFTSGGTSNVSSPALLTVYGVPVTEWTFPITVAPPIVGVSPQVGTGVLVPLGMTNDYTGVDSQPVDDVTSSSTVTANGDFNFSENTFRVRGGSGGGTTGSAGSPDGWSGFAPAGTQGLEFDVPTSGFSNVVFHFDWYSTTSGPKTAQLQYTTDGSTWVNYSGGLLVAHSNDYYGANSTGAPTGVTMNFQGITAANDDSNFKIRIVSEYQPTDYTSADLTNEANNTDNALPQIYDDNYLINGGVGYHGQYATADPTAGAYTSQEIQIGGSGDTGTFNLSIGGLSTGPISYDSGYTLGGTVSNEATDIQTALDALAGYSKTTVTSLDGIASNYIITFANAQTGAMTATPITLSGSYDSANNTNPGVNVIYAGSLIPYTTSGSGNWRFGNISLTGASTTGAPGILTDPQSQTASLPLGGGTANITLTSTAYSETGMTGVQWLESTDGGNSFVNVSSGGTNLNSSGNVYSSTFVFAANSTSQSGVEFEAQFSNGTLVATTTAATVLVVEPIAPSFTLPGASAGITESGQPYNTSAVAGSSTFFTAEVTGLPLSSSISLTNGVQWEYSTNGGSSWSNVSTNSTTTITTTIANLASGYQTSTSILSLPAVQAQSGYEYEAIFTDAAGPATSNPVTLTVLHAESPVVEYTFGGNASGGVQSAPYNNPTADTNASSGVLYNTAYNSSDGTLSSLGFNDPNFPSVTADDVTLSPGTVDPNYTANTWRIRGGTSATAPGSPANGWDYLAPQYSQGAEIDINTTGLQDVYVGFQWYTTAQGVRDLQEQYNTNINNPNGWTNINPLLVAPNGGDFYGATNATTPPTGALIDLTGITGANNNPDFGIRLVAAWDPYFGYNYSDSSTVQSGNQLNTPEPRGEYAAATLVNGNPVPLNGSSGNWRFANIVVSGVEQLPTWLSASTSAASWNPFTESLNVTGSATIIANPAASGDAPVITVNGSSALLDIDPTTGRNVSIGGLSITGNAKVAMTSTSDILVLPAGSLSIAAGSQFDIGSNYMDVQAANASQGAAALTIISTLIGSGFNHGAWTGTGIISSAAQSNKIEAVGYILNNGLYNSTNPFAGMTPGMYDVLARYTYYGDANLDGKVDGSDYSLIDNGYLNHLSGWSNGDFNYDNSIDGSDYTLIDNAFNTQGAQLAALIATPAGKFASGSAIRAAVPTNMLATIPSETDQQLKKKKSTPWASTLIDSIQTT
jgi:hypothetical protein